MTFSYMDPLSFFGRLVQKAVVICFFDSFVKTKQSDGSCNATIDSQLSCKVFKKQPFHFKKKHTKNIVWAKSTALPTRMPKFPYNPIADFTFYCWVTLKSCYRNWTHSVSHMNTWTVSIHCSSVSSVQKLLSRMFKCLITSKDQSILIKETEEWTEFPASRRREFWGKVKKALIELLPTDKINANEWISLRREIWTSWKDKIWSGIIKNCTVS